MCRNPLNGIFAILAKFLDSGQLFLLYTTCEIFCHFPQLIRRGPLIDVPFTVDFSTAEVIRIDIWQTSSKFGQGIIAAYEYKPRAEYFSQSETEEHFEWTIAREDRIVNKYWTRLNKIS